MSTTPTGVESIAYFERNADLRYEVEVPDLVWYQGSSVRFDVTCARGRTALVLPSTAYSIWRAWLSTDTDTLYIENTGTVQDASAGIVRHELTPSQANLPTGTYEYAVTVYNADGSYAGASCAGEIDVRFSPVGDDVTYVGTSPAYGALASTDLTDTAALMRDLSDDLTPTLGGDLDADGKTISGPLDPTLGTHVGDRDYNDGRYLELDGTNAMTGDIDMADATKIEWAAGQYIQGAADATIDFYAAGYDFGGFGELTNISDPSDATGVGDRGYNDLRYLRLTGDTMTGDLNMGGKILLSPLDPTLGAHVGDRDYNDARYATAAQGALADSATQPATVTDTTVDYTLALTDAGDIITVTSATAKIITVPANAAVAFPTATIINIVRAGAGTVAVTGDTGVTVNGTSGGSVSISAQWQGVTLLKTAADTWIASGAL